MDFAECNSPIFVNDMKYAIIGTGWIAESFKKAGDTVENFECFCVCSRTYEKGIEFCKKTGIKKVVTSIEELVKLKEVEAVYIASPNVCHYEQSKYFLENGKHVLCEKPITVTEKEFDELYSLAKRKKLVYLQALIQLHFQNTVLLEKAITKIGNITSAHLDFSQYSSKYESYLAGENPNIFNPLMKTGCLMDLGVYNISLAIRLFGYPREIVSKSQFMESGADSNGSAVFVYDDKLVTLTASKVGQSRGASQIIGDKGTVTLSSVSKITDVRLYDLSGNETVIAGDSTKTEVMSPEALNFKNAIENFEENLQFLDFCANISRLTLCAIETIKRQNNF